MSGRVIESSHLRFFLAESLRIEGIRRPPTKSEIAATLHLLMLPAVTVDDVVRLVGVYAPGHVLRACSGLDVRVGNYVAPRGGPGIVASLRDILGRINGSRVTPWDAHVEYEHLHPFTDGNGRSGRALWAWQMVRQQASLPLGFLHQFYYQTLSACRLPATADRRAPE